MNPSSKKRKRDGAGNTTLTKRDRKRRIKELEKLCAVTNKKIDERIHKDNIALSPISKTLTLAKIAYDAARSGTVSQVADIRRVAHLIVPSIHIDGTKEHHATADCLLSEASLYAEAAFLFALSGIGSSEHDVGTVDEVQRDLYCILCQNCTILLEAACRRDMWSVSTLKSFTKMVEQLAVSGIRSVSDSNGGGFHKMALMLSDYVKADNNLRDSDEWEALSEFLSEELSSNDSGIGHMGYCLYSRCNRPLTALWSHSAKQKKVRCAGVAAAPGIRIAKLSVDRSVGRVIWAGDSPLGFTDMSRPLVIDVGCGFGVSLLGLASCHNEPRGAISRSWNYLGCDLSAHCISYAQGVASRWGLSSTCRFCVAPAEDFLLWVKEHYPGPVVWVLVQFPTPYKLESSGSSQIKKELQSLKSKNSQLPVLSPSSLLESTDCNDDSGFMVTNTFVQLVLDIAANKCPKICSACATATTKNIRMAVCTCNAGMCGVYAQSNVEDVAVTMKRRFEANMNAHTQPNDSLPLKFIVSSNAIAQHIVSDNGTSQMSFSCSGKPTVSKRQEAWEAAGGERALVSSTTGTGVNMKCNGWMATSPLPFYARTETEAAYAMSKKAVFRIGWSVYCAN